MNSLISELHILDTFIKCENKMKKRLLSSNVDSIKIIIKKSSNIDRL
jgi:hypothetical protein